MADETKTLIIEADVTKALAAEDQLTAATERREAAVRELADRQNRAEREQIEALKASNDEVKRAIGLRREQMLLAREAVREATEAQRSARDAVRAEGQSKRDDLERRASAFGPAVDATAKTREWEASVKNVRQSYLDVASSVGNVISGLQSAVALGREVVRFVDDTVRESFEVQSIAKNLQLDIGPARAALQGLVSDKDIALAANKAVAMGVAQTGTEFAHIAEMVATQAAKLGKEAPQLLNDYVEAVGKQESEIFDNLGLTLRLTDAYEIYAKSVGKSAKDLTAHEKSVAFNKAALLSLEKATGQAAVKVDGFADSWVKMTVSVSNINSGLLGFQDTAGRVNEALRVLSDDEIDRLARLDKDTKIHGQSLNDIDDMLKQWRLSLSDLKKIADEQGISFEQMLENAKQAHANQAEALRRQAVEADLTASVSAANEQAEALEHTAKLLDIQGASQKDVLATEIQALEVQRDAMIVQAYLTKSADDERKIRQLNYQIELKNAQLTAPKRGGGRRADPNAAINRERDATLGVLDARAKIAEAQQDQLRDAGQIRTIELFLLDIERQKLDVREQAERARDPKKAADIAKRDAELLKIATDRQLLTLQAEAAAQADAQAAAERRIAMLDREIERNEVLGVSVELLRKQRAAAAMQAVEAWGTTEEIDQARHEREITNIEEARERRVAVEQERLAEFEREVELAQARGELVRDEEARRLEFEARIAEAEGGAERRREFLHKREVARIAERVRKQQAAVQATNGFLGQAQAFGQLIVDNAIKNDARREKAALRLNGVMALARGALETVEAVAAFARYDFVGGALHTAAAAVAFTQGAIMMSGQVPGAGGGAAASPGSFGSEGQFTKSSWETTVAGGGSGGMRDRPSAPPSAEELTRLRGGYGARPSNDQAAGPQQVVNISHSTIVGADTGTMLADLGSRQNAKKYGT